MREVVVIAVARAVSRRDWRVESWEKDMGVVGVISIDGHHADGLDG